MIIGSCLLKECVNNDKDGGCRINAEVQIFNGYNVLMEVEDGWCMTCMGSCNDFEPTLSFRRELEKEKKEYQARINDINNQLKG